MSLYGMLRASVSGLNAQSARLGSISSNIANASTTGYKEASTEFSSLILNTAGGVGSRGGVISHTQHDVRQQGALEFTTSATDLAISGNGFFVVQRPSGESFLTRAGAFVPNAEGDLVNTAGYQLMGRPISGTDVATAVNGTADLEAVSLSSLSLQANPTTSGSLRVNLPSDADAVAAADLPSANTATATYTDATSLVAYDNLGAEVVTDIYFSKVADETWEVVVYDRADAAPDGRFPYANPAIATTTLNFDPTNGQLDTTGPTSITIPVPNGQPLELDLSRSTQLATNYSVVEAVVNGNAPSDVERVEFTDDGTLYAIYENGSAVATHRIPFADVPSPDLLTPISGNIFALSGESGPLRIGFPGGAGFGVLVDGALEQSTVDLATELTDMIEAQRNYTANSKSFQTGSELLDVLVNLKR